jgi:hypothetical protein
VDTCLTKRLNFGGFRDFAAGPPSDPNSVNLHVYRSTANTPIREQIHRETLEFNGMTTKNNKDGR